MTSLVFWATYAAASFPPIVTLRLIIGTGPCSNNRTCGSVWKHLGDSSICRLVCSGITTRLSILGCFEDGKMGDITHIVTTARRHYRDPWPPRATSGGNM